MSAAHTPTLKATEKQIKRLIAASESLAAAFAIDACRVISEGADDLNLVPFLDTLPVKTVREFDEAIFAITDGQMDSAAEEQAQRAKYEAAMLAAREQSK